MVRVPAGFVSTARGAAAGSTSVVESSGRHGDRVRTDQASRSGARWPTWPPEPFPSPAEQPPMRPAPVRVSTTKVVSPPAHTRGVVEPSAPSVRVCLVVRSWPSRPAVEAVAPQRSHRARCPAAAELPRGRRTRVRTGPRPSGGEGESPRGRRWLAMVVIVLTAVVGGAVGLLVTRDDPDHAGRSTASTTAVIAATVAPPTTAPASTVAPSTTAAVATGPNVLGIVDGTPADHSASRPARRSASPPTSASMIPRHHRRRWWRSTPVGGSSSSGLQADEQGRRTASP